MTKFKYVIGGNIIEGEIETSENSHDNVNEVLRYIAKTENQSLKVALMNTLSNKQMGFDIINPDDTEGYIDSDIKVSSIEIYDSNMWRKVSLIFNGFVG
ncbi:hypothetical protein [Aeromonas veronii]|uniref:hypothetical protein n=1 Tax=Aeromonas veronii TaxID=654 RepID=UPI001117967C|nr:hypothetical protein [Aeromonas veronii]TNJ08530.1 hypothetical protein CF113_21110 [Aeromonas veronii]